MLYRGMLGWGARRLNMLWWRLLHWLRMHLVGRRLRLGLGLGWRLSLFFLLWLGLMALLSLLLGQRLRSRSLLMSLPDQFGPQWVRWDIPDQSAKDPQPNIV
jgi:hypothetical protein